MFPIIIVNYNSIDLTIDCVNSIFQQTADVKFEIIIVDNASKNKRSRKITGGI
ncbi:MAG: glycosyltransferase family 2 protein [Fusicatenibacter saccharivorans]